MRIYRLPEILKLVYPGALFSFPASSKTIYLTFDDGPSDGVTQALAEVLEKRGVPATFFVNGIQVEKYPVLFKLLQDGGNAIGNHGYRHMNGCKTKATVYFENVVKGAEISGSEYFRPPYGKISLAQFREVKKSYKTVFWSLMPYDFDQGMSGKRMLNILKKGVSPGSIIALHDNKKSKAPGFLNEFIEYCIDCGYSFDTIH